jgi:protein-S-isoprenylcysteine O-methyltransferase Ste14
MGLPMRSLEHKIPPPIVAAVIAVAMWALARITPAIALDNRLRLAVAGAFLGFAVCVTAMGMIAFRRARTTINPVNIAGASSMVTSGIYSRTRNPMYVGLTSLLLAWTTYLASPTALLGPIIFFLFTTRFQIIPEERFLTTKFGDQYTAYQQRVRRWL